MSGQSNKSIQQPFYGRQTDIDQVSAFIRNNTPQTPKLILVGGQAGIGKTTLINNYLSNNLSENDCFLFGKYDENMSSLPYQGIVLALNSYKSNYITSDSELTSFFNQLSDKLGINYEVLSSLIPDFSNASNKSNNFSSYSLHEMGNRFLLSINQFFEFVSKKHSTLYLFIDDLHWADKETSILLESLLNNNNLSNLIIFGTYRTEEMGLSHPVAMLTRSKSLNKESIFNLDLHELDESDIEKITRDITKLHDNNLNKLTSHLYQKSSGNPLYLKEILDSIIDPNDSRNSEYDKIDFDSIEWSKFSTNIVDMLIIKLRRISPEMQNILETASCLGTKFNLRVIADFFKESFDHIESLVHSSIELGLIKPGYSAKGTDYYFAHDKIRQTAYKLVKNKPELHLKLGKHLFDNIKDSNVESTQLNQAIYHLNIGKDLIDNELEKLELCKFNLKVATTEKNTGAYSAAKSNLEAARSMLPIDSWSKHHKLTYGIYKNLAECYYLTGQYNEASEMCNTTLDRATDIIEKLELHKIKIIELTHMGNWQGALDEGLLALSLFDINLEEPSEQDLGLDEINNIPVKDFRELATCTNEEIITLTSLMNSLVSPIYVLRPDLMVNLNIKFLNLAMQHGNSPDTTYAYTFYAIVVGPISGDYSRAKEFCLLSLFLNTKLNDHINRCKIKLSYATNILPWNNHITDGFKFFDEGEKEGFEAGDFINAGYCVASKSIQLVTSGINLEEVSRYINDKIHFLQETQNPVIVLVQLGMQYLTSLYGQTTNTTSLSSDKFDEDKVLESMTNSSFLHGIHFYHTCKLQLAVIYDDLSQVEQHIAGSRDTLSGAIGQFSVADFNFYHSLVLTRKLVTDNHVDRKSVLELLETNQKQLKIWAENCPANFLHKYTLIQAEIENINNNTHSAMNLYKKAKNIALSEGFLQDAAISLERHALAVSKDSDQDILTPEAKALLEAATDCYRQWGATGKVDQLSALT